MNKNYEEALDLYSKAIEIEPNEPAFYTNSNLYTFFYNTIYIGAAVYIALEKFDESITDCDRA
jgi:tetratricopeptide (TPR) repeat protein